MSIMRANLKHLYQRKALLLPFLFLAYIFVVIVFFTEKGSGAIFGVLMLMFYMGLFIGALQIEIMTKPFSYCLPGHRGVPVKFLAWVCVITSLIPSLAFLFRIEARGFAVMMLHFLTVFLFSTIGYWVGVSVPFRCRNCLAAIGFLGFGPLIIVGAEYNILVESFIFDNWFAILLLGIGVNYIACRLLSSDDLARRHCGKMWMGAFDTWNKEKMAKFQQIKLKEKEKKKEKQRQYLSPKVEEFFLAKISDQTMSDTAKHIWSGLYRSFAIVLSTNQRSFLIMMPLLVCFMCYIGFGGVFIYIFPGLMVIHMSLHVQSPLLISGGRRERFYTALVSAVTVSVLIFFVLLLVAPISVLLAPTMPKILSLTFHPLNMKFSFIPLLVVPLAFTGTHLFPKQTMLSKMVPIFGIIMFVQLFVFMDIAKKPIPLTLSMIAVAIVLSWAAFILLLRYICTRRCLAQ